MRILYEITDGKFCLIYEPKERRLMDNYLKEQKRFVHLKPEHIQKIQAFVNNKCREVGVRPISATPKA